MTREQVIDMFTMRYDGCTLQFIGDKYGVSKEFVRQLVGTEYFEKQRRVEEVIFPKVKEWMIKNHCSIRKLGALMGFKSEHATNQTIANILRGKSEMRISHVKKIHQVTGLSLEEIMEVDHA